MSVRIQSKLAGFSRCGIQFSEKKTYYGKDMTVTGGLRSLVQYIFSSI